MSGADVDDADSWVDLTFGTESTRHPAESEEHHEKKIEVAKHLLEQGFTVSVEHTLDSKGYIVDVYGVNGYEIHIYEVGRVGESKHGWLEANFKNYHHVPYNSDGQEVIAVVSEGDKERVSLTLDKDTLERIDSIPGVKRSTLLNDIAEEWLDENGY